jgi:hypothetical protein
LTRRAGGRGISPRHLHKCYNYFIDAIIPDPIRKTIEVHAQGKAVQTLRIGDTLDGGDLLPVLTIKLADVFR